ncbi:MAG: hypothetical protein ABSH10_05845 [Phycisphaerae bacterium]|jgi:hypothetical protein
MKIAWASYWLLAAVAVCWIVSTIGGAGIPTTATSPATQPSPLVSQELAALRAENQRLRLQVQTLQTELAALRAQLTALKASASKTPPPTSQPDTKPTRQVALETITLTNTSKLVGARIFGLVMVTAIKPDPNQIGHYVIEAALTNPDIDGLVSVSEGDFIPAVVFRCPEETALRLRQGRKINVAGDVERAEIKQTEIYGALPGSSKVVFLHLRNVSAR